MKKLAILCAFSVALLVTNAKVNVHGAEPLSPEGVYYNISDEGEDKGKAASHIQVWVKDGVAYGKIIKLLLKPQDQKCDKCKGDLKDKPVVGMVFLRGLKYNAKDGEWSGGQIMDPNNGKWYKCYIKVMDGGKKLKVRGYIGVSVLGRTQWWFKLK